MALTQMQVIQSLGEAMSWFERELGWGVDPAELRHLCGRIGELYSALITNGQLAPENNQKGYDVVSKDGERISVKTTTMKYGAGHVSFNPSTLDRVDRVMILFINVEEMQVEILLDCTVAEAKEKMAASTGGRTNIALSKLMPSRRDSVRQGEAVKEVSYRDVVLRELESGTIEICRNGESVKPVKPKLRQLAQELNIPIVNSNGNAMNTQQLGTVIIRTINQLQGT